MGKVHLLSLGCPKNLVDSEKLLRKLDARGLHYCSHEDEADVILVNTCGFIEDAKRESIDEILRIAQLKARGENKKLIVFGCLAKRFGAELKKEIPEIDALWGVGEEGQIVEYCSRVMPPALVRGAGSGVSSSDRFIDTPYAYLKIAEGCDRKCTYCVIPGIRGGFKSRRPDEILAEAADLLQAGKKELIIVAQDITSYGKEFGYSLSRLIREIAAIGGDFWIRLLYLYPTSIDERLIETIASEEKVCKYIDMPLQHSSEKILKLMGRAGSAKYFERLIGKIRAAIPEVAIRTTFIVGFPQETKEDFEGLVNFAKKMKFERLGVFTYSKEEGTPSAGLKGQVPVRIKKARYERLMEVQSSISLERNRRLAGRTFTALVEEVGEDITVARIYSQAPEIDGVAMIADRNVKKGEFVSVEIAEVYDYDLKGRIK